MNGEYIEEKGNHANSRLIPILLMSGKIELVKEEIDGLGQPCVLLRVQSAARIHSPRANDVFSPRALSPASGFPHLIKPIAEPRYFLARIHLMRTRTAYLCTNIPNHAA